MQFNQIVYVVSFHAHTAREKEKDKENTKEYANISAIFVYRSDKWTWKSAMRKKTKKKSLTNSLPFEVMNMDGT